MRFEPDFEAKKVKKGRGSPLVRMRGLEPPSLTAQPPQDCASTISPHPRFLYFATSAQERTRTSIPFGTRT